MNTNDFGRILTNASAVDRNKTDYYPTPPECTRVLANYMRLNGKRVWEPACGAGHMASELEQCGAEVIATELHYQGYGEGGVDFLTADMPEGVDAIVTNPPFRLSAQFIERCIGHGVSFAMLLKSQCWHSARRRDLFEAHRPSAVLPLTWRPDFHFGARGGSPTMEVIWTVWGNRPANITEYLPMPRAALN